METKRSVIISYNNRTFRFVNQEKLKENGADYIYKELIRPEVEMVSIIIIDRNYDSIYEYKFADEAPEPDIKEMLQWMMIRDSYIVDCESSDSKYDYLSRSDEAELYRYIADIYYDDRDTDSLYIELSDTSVLRKIDNPIHEDVYSSFVSAFLEHFFRSTGTYVLLRGRSNRHACIEINNANLLDFDDLKKIYHEYEKLFIQTLNSLPPTKC